MRNAAPTGFGEWSERRQADRFYADLVGSRVGPPVETEDEDAENEIPEPRLPARPPGARGGKAFMETIKGEGRPANWEEREDKMVAELLSGNVPDFMRRWVSVKVSRNDETPKVKVRVLPDYLCVGDDTDYRHLPLDQQSAQKVADAFHTILPTAKICHAIWRRTPWSRTIGAIERDYLRTDRGRKAPWGRLQTSTAAYDDHSVAIQDRMKAMSIPLGELVAGHKKDVVLSRRLHTDPSRIAFHGFYRDRYPYEPCYDNPSGQLDPNCNRELPAHDHPEGRGHFSDYSQGVRLVHPFMRIDGVRHLVADVLRDKTLSKLISADGEIVPPRIPPPPR
jgi:hypothetical protein